MTTDIQVNNNFGNKVTKMRKSELTSKFNKIYSRLSF